LGRNNLQHLMMILIILMIINIIYFIQELPGDMTGISKGG